MTLGALSWNVTQLLSRNMSELIKLMAKDGELVLDWDDEVVAGTCVTRKEVAA